MKKTEENQENKILDKLEKNKDGKYILPLVNPITFGSEVIDHLELMEPKAKHIRKMPAEPIVDDVLKVCADLACRNDAFMDELSLKDVNSLGEFFGAFG